MLISKYTLTWTSQNQKGKFAKNLLYFGTVYFKSIIVL